MRKQLVVLSFFLLWGTAVWSDPPAQLLSFTLRNGEIRLKFSKPITYSAERFQYPPRLVVNLYNCRLEKSRQELKQMVLSWASEVRVQDLFTDSVRLIFFLQGEVRPEVFASPQRNEIAITPAGRTSSPNRGLERRDETPPLRENEGSSSDPSSLDQVPSSSEPPRIGEFHFHREGEIAFFEVDLTGRPQPKVFFLKTDPSRPRIVIDLPGASFPSPDRVIPIEQDPLVRRIHSGMFEGRIPRIVLTVKGQPYFKWRLEEGKFVMLLSSKPLPQEEGNAQESVSLGKEDSEGEAPPPEYKTGPLRGTTVVIDPGHGGSSPGARGFGMLEKDLTLDISLRLHRLLLSAGVNSVLTREDDRFVALDARPQIANRLGADMFISIHINSTGGRRTWSGTQTYYHMNNATSRALAKAVQSALVETLNLPDRGVRSDRTLYRTGLAVLRYAQVPAILVEVAYINHPGDAALLAQPEFRQKVAEALFEGIRRFREEGLGAAGG